MATLTVHRRTLAPLLGMHERFTASSGANNTTGQIECTTASHTGLRFKSTVNARSLLEDKWLFRPSAAAAGDKDRRIDTYTPSSGLATSDDAWTNAPTSEAFEIDGLVSGTEMHEWLNEGLKLCFVVVEFTFTVASSTTKRHDLSTANSWLTDPKWIYQVGSIASSDSRGNYDEIPNQRRGSAWKDGATVYVGGSFSTTDTMYVKAIKPAYYHCKTSAGSYGGQSGLALETDESPIDEFWLAWAAVLVGRNRLDTLLQTDAATKEARESRAMAAARFRDLREKNLDLPERTFVSLPSIVGPAA